MTAAQAQSEGGDKRAAAKPDLGDSIALLMRAVDKGRESVLKPHGLNTMEFNLLRALKRSDRTATSLLDAMPVDASRISRLVAGLADKGLLRRRRLRNDRRTVMLRLTEQGERLTGQLQESVAAYEDGLVQGLGPKEQRAFYAAAERILANDAALRPKP